MKPLLLSFLSDLPGQIKEAIDCLQPETLTEAIAFFDLCGSTPLKLQKGHDRGLTAALRFCCAAEEITMICDGVVVKQLGDGILARFADPIDACRAAVNLKLLCRDLGLLGSFGMTIGRITRYVRSNGSEDIYGAAVDRCARIQSVAFPGQIVIDDALHEILRSYLSDYADLVVSALFTMQAKGTGALHLCEISTHDLGLIGKIGSHFHIHTAGRLAIEEKVQFMCQADSEIIEIGTGLTSFAKYFTGQKPKEFKDHIRKLLSRGVSVKCFAVDPEHGPAIASVAGAKEYLGDSMRAKELIIEERKTFLAQGLPAELEYYCYRTAPVFHCLCIDGTDALNARMLFSPYLPGLSRAECPVLQVSRIAMPELFEKYWSAVEVVQRQSVEVFD